MSTPILNKKQSCWSVATKHQHLHLFANPKAPNAMQNFMHISKT